MIKRCTRLTVCLYLRFVVLNTEMDGWEMCGVIWNMKKGCQVELAALIFNIYK